MMSALRHQLVNILRSLVLLISNSTLVRLLLGLLHPKMEASVLMKAFSWNGAEQRETPNGIILKATSFSL